MKKRLHVPSVLAVAVVLGGAAVAAAVGVAGCDSEGHRIDASVPDDSGCGYYCVPDGTDAGVCPSPLVCAEGSGHTCPAGCTPVG